MTFNPHFPELGIIALAFAACVLVALLVLRSSQVREKNLRWIVLALRIPVILFLAASLLNPVSRQGVKQKRKRCSAVMLVDTSRSMSLGSLTRLAQVSEAVSAAWEAVPAESAPLVFTFADEISEVALSRGSELPEPVGNASMLGGALLRAVDRAHAAGAKDIILMTDGRLHDPDVTADAVRAARSRGIAVHCFPVGTAPQKPNLSIVNCLVERHVPAESIVPVTIVIEAVNSRHAAVTTRLRNADGEVVDEVRFEAVDGANQRTLHAPVERDDTSFTIEVDPLPEEISDEDNVFEFAVTVSDPCIRVLYMEGSNHKDKRWGDVWEYDFIPNALRETGRIDVDVLTVDEQVVDGGKLFSPADEKIGFPGSREDLYEYDVIICSDINRSIFTPEQLQWTVDLVSRRGGGFCMIGGYTAFGAGRWDKTVWEKMIPVDMKNEDEGYVWEDIKPVIPDAVRKHPIWCLDPDEDANVSILDRHPAFLGTNLVNRAKPAATVLAIAEKRDMPLIAVQAYGRGRSMAFTSDAAGGWGERYQTEWGEGDRDNRYYRRFWVNTVRWLAANSAARYETELVGTTEAVNYRPGDTVPLRITKRNQPDIEALRKLIVTAKLEGHAGNTPLRLDESTETFTGDLFLPKDLTDDSAAIVFTAKTIDGKDAGNAHTTVRLLHTSRELENPTPDRDFLAGLAEVTNGSVLQNGGDIVDLLRQSSGGPDEEEKPFTVPAWDKAVFWGFLILLLTAEWFIRKWVKLQGA